MLLGIGGFCSFYLLNFITLSSIICWFNDVYVSVTLYGRSVKYQLYYLVKCHMSGAMCLCHRGALLSTYLWTIVLFAYVLCRYGWICCAEFNVWSGYICWWFLLLNTAARPLSTCIWSNCFDFNFLCNWFRFPDRAPSFPNKNMKPKVVEVFSQSFPTVFNHPTMPLHQKLIPTCC